MANANAKSKPAGINDKVDIDVMSMVQIVEKNKENKKNTPVKKVVTNAAKVIRILSTDLDLGVTIKAYDGVKQKENTVAR